MKATVLVGATVCGLMHQTALEQDSESAPPDLEQATASKDRERGRDAILLRPLPLNYPSQALREERQGRVSYRVTVGTNGRAEDCSVTKSSGHQVLDEDACKTVMRYGRFRPALDDDGNPIRQSISREATYQLSPATPE